MASVDVSPVTTDRAETGNPSTPLLRVEDLRVSFVLGSGIDLVAVRGVGFDIYPQEIVGLVGESGSGKSLTARACLRLIRPPGSFTARTLAFGDLDLMTASDATMRSIRGDRMALVPQDPLSSFHPSLRIGKQMDDALEGPWRASP